MPRIVNGKVDEDDVDCNYKKKEERSTCSGFSPSFFHGSDIM